MRRKDHNCSQSGQTFIEFLFLLLTLIGLSFVLLRGMNGAVAERWKGMVQVISNPTDSTIDIR